MKPILVHNYHAGISGENLRRLYLEKMRKIIKENGKIEMDYAKKNGQKRNRPWVSEAKKVQAGWKRKRER